MKSVQLVVPFLSLFSIAFGQSGPPCSQPDPIEHGLTDWDGKSTLARYACFQGYHLIGPPQVECRYGTWYSDEPVSRPTCKPIICGQPHIINGKLNTGEKVRYRSGEEAQVVCEEGFELKMSGRIICKEDGTWDSAEQTEFPVCKEKTCAYPDDGIPIIENGSVEINGNRQGPNGGYKPGSVALYQCDSGFVLVPLSAEKRVCLLGKWKGNLPACIPKTEAPSERTHCSAPLTISNGYYFTDRSSEAPLALPKVSGIKEQYERGTIARYHCKEGYTLSSFHGQEIYRCSLNGKWTPTVPPVCLNFESSQKDPLSQVMCLTPPIIPYADFDRIEGWLTSNGAIHGTILEYHCRVGYRDSRTPCLPTRRTCHAGQWVGRKPSCVPFDYCERPPIVSHGYMKSTSENVYHVLSEVHYECHAGFRIKGSDTLKCHATGCWIPNDLPECIREDLYESSWNGSDPNPVPIVAILISISVGCTIIALFTTVCLVLVCRRKGGPLPPPSGPAHWSTTVTVTPDCGRGRTSALGSHISSGDPALVRSRQDHDRMALIAFADGVQQVTLPSYEEALRDSTTNPVTNGIVQDYNGILNGQQQVQLQQQQVQQQYVRSRQLQYRSGREQPQQVGSMNTRRSRHPAGPTIYDNNTDSISHHSAHAWPSRQHRRRRDTDAMSDSASHHSIQVWQSSNLSNCRQVNSGNMTGSVTSASSGSAMAITNQINGSSSQSTSLRSSKSSHSANSAETLGGQDNNHQVVSLNGQGDAGNGSSSQNPSCRALAGSLASFDTAVVNTEGIPLLEENELETEGSGSSVSGETGSATYSETSSKT